jgi:hypothetical protein
MIGNSNVEALARRIARPVPNERLECERTADTCARNQQCLLNQQTFLFGVPRALTAHNDAEFQIVTAAVSTLKARVAMRMAA